MKWLFILKDKLKIAFVLPVMVVLIILMIAFSKHEITHIDKSVSSIYYDRLVAAKTITQIMDLLYENRFILSKYIQADNSFARQPIEQKLARNNRLMDSLIHEFEKTVLVKEEETALTIYKQKIQAHIGFQQQVINLYKVNNKDSLVLAYGQQEESSFQDVITPLRQLSMIQPNVGKQLLQDSQNRIRIVQEISFLEIAFIIILCAVIEMSLFLLLMKVSRGVEIPSQKYWLN